MASTASLVDNVQSNWAHTSFNYFVILPRGYKCSESLSIILYNAMYIVYAVPDDDPGSAVGFAFNDATFQWYSSWPRITQKWRHIEPEVDGERELIRVYETEDKDVAGQSWYSLIVPPCNFITDQCHDAVDIDTM